MYGQRKPLALRTPLLVPDGRKYSSRINRLRSLSEISTPGISTPSFTEGETATETEVETEVEDYLPAREMNIRPPLAKVSAKKRSRPMTQHDLLVRYFRKDLIGLHNIDLLR
jgi:phosphatidylethanolamine N-methyltransferase